MDLVVEGDKNNEGTNNVEKQVHPQDVNLHKETRHVRVFSQYKVRVGLTVGCGIYKIHWNNL